MLQCFCIVNCFLIIECVTDQVQCVTAGAVQTGNIFTGCFASVNTGHMDQKTKTGGFGSFLLVIVQIIAAFIQEGKGRLPELGNLCLIGVHTVKRIIIIRICKINLIICFTEITAIILSARRSVSV